MNIDWNHIAQHDEHRTWRTPDRPWLMTMTWRDLLFSHWPVDPEVLKSRLPSSLTLETYEGSGWVSVIAFEITNTLPRVASWLPISPTFPELNLRTYVSLDGEKPGIWFFGLDTTSLVTVAGGRAGFHLPYHRATMSIDRSADEVAFSSRRRGTNVRFAARYRADSPVHVPRDGSLDAWLLARYCLYSADSKGRIHRAEVTHPEPQFHTVAAEISQNTVVEPLGPVPRPQLSHYVRRLHTVVWGPERVGHEPSALPSGSRRES